MKLHVLKRTSKNNNKRLFFFVGPFLKFNHNCRATVIIDLESESIRRSNCDCGGQGGFAEPICQKSLEDHSYKHEIPKDRKKTIDIFNVTHVL